MVWDGSEETAAADAEDFINHGWEEVLERDVQDQRQMTEILAQEWVDLQWVEIIAVAPASAADEAAIVATWAHGSWSEEETMAASHASYQVYEDYLLEEEELVTQYKA